MSLIFDEDGNVLVEDVTFSEVWEEISFGDSGVARYISWSMSMTLTNNTETRLPIWISSTIRLVYEGNLLTVGLSTYDSQGNPDYDMKLLHPGTNHIKIENNAAPPLSLDRSVSKIIKELNPPTFGCLSIGVAVE